LLEWKVSEQGELLIRGGSFFQGYYNKPDSIAQRVREGWYHTGDAVSLTDSGELVFLERLDDLRRLRSGERFPPQFIETRLRFSPFIKDIMTLGDETRDNITALINIDKSVVPRWAEIVTSAFPPSPTFRRRPMWRNWCARRSAGQPFPAQHARVRRSQLPRRA